MTESRPDFTELPDLASGRLGGSVVAASDELFAEKENLIKPGAPVFAAGEFGNRGKIYDGWETRRRREPGHDHAIVRLGVPGIVHGVVVDTSFFRGNYPPQVSVEALGAEGYPSPGELSGMTWHTLVARADARGDTVNVYPVADRRRRWPHVRLSIYPDGGVARFAGDGQGLAEPRPAWRGLAVAGGAAADAGAARYPAPVPDRGLTRGHPCPPGRDPRRRPGPVPGQRRDRPRGAGRPQAGLVGRAARDATPGHPAWRVRPGRRLPAGRILRASGEPSCVCPSGDDPPSTPRPRANSADAPFRPPRDG